MRLLDLIRVQALECPVDSIKDYLPNFNLGVRLVQSATSGVSRGINQGLMLGKYREHTYNVPLKSFISASIFSMRFSTRDLWPSILRVFRR
jgi:hypothetical protein